MTAIKMFKELGYEYSKETDRNIFIKYYNEEGNQFVFWIDEQEFSASVYSITVDEFKAIQQQMRELGWI